MTIETTREYAFVCESGTLVGIKGEPRGNRTLFTYTVTLTPRDAAALRTAATTLFREEFPVEAGPIVTPARIGREGHLVIGRALSAPRCEDRAGKLATPYKGSIVRLSGTLKPTVRDGQAGVIFVVKKVIVIRSAVVTKPRPSPATKARKSKRKPNPAIDFRILQMPAGSTMH